MINHARTLLLNQSRRSAHYSDIGYAYVPPEFQPVELTSTLNLVRETLFGATPDNYFLNYRVRELLSYIHATELADYIYALDPRVTYWPELNKPFFEPTSKRVSITQTYGLPGRFAVNGNLRSLNSLGRAYNQYTVDLYRVVNGENITLQLRLQHVGRFSQPIVAEVNSVDTPPVLTLPDTDIKLRLSIGTPLMQQALLLSERNDNIETETYTFAIDAYLATERNTNRRVVTAGDALTVVEFYDPVTGVSTYTEESPTARSGVIARWFIETKVTPDPILPSAIPALELIGEPASLELFGLEDKEPYLTFKNLWFDNPLPAYRLSGIVLALIYRTNELRG